MNVFYWDWEFSWLYAIQQLHNPVLDKLMILLSTLGDGGILWIALGLLLLWPKRYRSTGIQMLVSIAITFIIGNLVLKNVVMRARPCMIDTTILPLIRVPGDYSFPSGHSMNGFTAAVALFCNQKKWGIPAIALAALIAFSRLYNFVHFPTDVMFGMLLGTTVAVVVCTIFRKKCQKESL